jgi:hypothetical protein
MARMRREGQCCTIATTSLRSRGPRFTPENDHDSGKTGERDRDLRRRAQTFARFHSYLSSTLRGELWKNYFTASDF